MNVRRTGLVALLNRTSPIHLESFQRGVVWQERKGKHHPCGDALRRGYSKEWLCVQAACDCHGATVDTKTGYGNISAGWCMYSLCRVQYIHFCQRLVKDWLQQFREVKINFSCTYFCLVKYLRQFLDDRCIIILEEFLECLLVFNCKREKFVLYLTSCKQGFNDYFNSHDFCFTL